MSSHTEQVVLLLLSDSNLPTGGFHFSAGLESATKHGLVPSSCLPSQHRPSSLQPFLVNNLRAHARSTLSFVAAAHTITTSSSPSSLNETLSPSASPLPSDSPSSSSLQANITSKADQIASIDASYHSLTSNHVTRRGSKTQGAGMLSLWSKSLKKPVYLVKGDRREEEADGLMEELRGRIRDGMLEGHQPISWGVLCGVLGLSKERTLHLHLYLHARSILSSSTRLNQIGPYNAQTLLLHTVPPIIDAELAYYLKELREGDVTISLRQLGADEEEEDDVGPAGVWPLGDLLQSRHDWMHSRMFNT